MTQMTDPKDNDSFLDDFLADARANAPVLSDDLRARILADADASLRPRSQPAPTRRSLWDRVGGWLPTSVAGGVTASLLGFWFGVATPMPLAALEVPVWADGVLVHFDTLAWPIVDLADTYLAGF